MSLLSGFLKTKKISNDGKAYLSLDNIEVSDILGLDKQIYMNDKQNQALSNPTEYKQKFDKNIKDLKRDVNLMFTQRLTELDNGADTKDLPKSQKLKIALKSAQALYTVEMDRINKSFPMSFGKGGSNVMDLLESKSQLKKLGVDV